MKQIEIVQTIVSINIKTNKNQFDIKLVLTYNYYTLDNFNGLIDEVHLYNRVLDDGEITSLASGVNVTPVEARGKLATVWGSLKRQQ